jgi:MFS family permease
MGDALIYVVMPLHAAAFGIGLPWVGLVLSVNRIVRILGYGWIEPLSRRIGLRTLVIAGAAAGPLLAGLLFGRVGVGVLYAALAALIALGLAQELASRPALERAARIDSSRPRA